MNAVDTNIIIHYLTNDDLKQASKARAVLDSGPIFVSTTVILESEWVLRSVYQLPPQNVLAALRTLLGLPNVTSQNPDLLLRAFRFADLGVDFADALHLAAAGNFEAMYTFDRRLHQASHRCFD